METTVADVMRKKFISFKKTDSLVKALDVAIHSPESAFPVVDDNGKIMGEIEQHELLKLAVPARFVSGEHVLGPEGIRDLMERSGKTVADFMKTHEIKVKKTTSVLDAARIMLDTEVRTLEVVDERGCPVGFVSEIDILTYLKKKLEGKRK